MLRSQGVNYRAIINRTGPICLRRIIIEDGSGLFEFDDELGEPAFIMAVHGLDAESVIDLVAWPIMRPEAFGSYFGYAGLLGGDAVVNPASFAEAPCPIWATPLAWLQAVLRGCVVLNPHLAAPILRQAPGPFQCEDCFAKILTVCCAHDDGRPRYSKREVARWRGARRGLDADALSRPDAKRLWIASVFRHYLY